MSQLHEKDEKHNIILGYNFLLYLKFLLGYITQYKKDINFFFFEFKALSWTISKLKKLNAKKYITITIEFFDEISQRKIPKKFKPFFNKLKKYFLGK